MQFRQLFSHLCCFSTAVFALTISHPVAILSCVLFFSVLLASICYQQCKNKEIHGDNTSEKQQWKQKDKTVKRAPSSYSFMFSSSPFCIYVHLLCIFVGLFIPLVIPRFLSCMFSFLSCFFRLFCYFHFLFVISYHAFHFPCYCSCIFHTTA